ncbi:MAG: Gfo/Idh/MocA family oxidoreductase [Armatimonadota bacterium]
MSIRIGVIGAGRRAGDHLEALQQIQEAAIVAVCDAQEGRARERADEFGGRVHGDFREMLSRTELDAVVITTPPLAHREQLVAAAERGAHVLVEKPLALSVEDMRAMAAAVEENGVVGSVSYQLRHLSTVEGARQLLDGRPVAAVAAHYYWTVPLVEWIQDKDLAGGQMVDQCTHLIDLCRLFAGEVESVSAAYTNVTRRDAAGFNNWDAYSATLAFEGGAVGSVHSTYALFPGIPGGTGLAIIADELLVRIDPGGSMRVHTPNGEESFEPEGDATLELNRTFVEAIESGDASGIRSPVEDAMRSCAVSLAANAAAQRGEVVSLAEFW